jgi:hypothetical protein
MEKLDRLGWAAGLSFLSHGVRIGIRVNNPEALQRVAERVPVHGQPCVAPFVDELCSLLVAGGARPPGVRRYNLLYWGSGRIARTLDEDDVFQQLEALLHFIISSRARRKVFLRAGVLAWHGQAILICGPRSGGTTTLVDALVEAGATHYSDQYAVVDARGHVHAYPHRLTSGDEKGVEFGDQSGTKPLPAGLVVLTEYQNGARWRPRTLSAGQGMLALLANTVQARQRPKVALAICRLVASSATILKGKRGEAEDTARPLLNHLCSGDQDGRLFKTRQA